MFCGNCGNNVHPGEKFCGACGAPASGAPESPPPAPPPPPPAYGAPQGYGAPPPAFGTPGGMPHKDVPNYLWQSIAVTLCCCLIGGAIAIIHATKVKPALERGDLQTALQESAAAKKWCIWSAVIGAILGIAIAALQVAAQPGQLR